MKKYGKYENRTDATGAKQSEVKSTLLQTYLTSLLCMVLCVAMFLGTTYAWFTSEVNNTANEIYVGTLKVGLYKGNDNLADSDKKLFDSNIRWEPGYTALETIQIVNEGDLAFKYVLSFTEGAAKDAEDQVVTPADVAKHFDVWVYDYYDHGNVAPTLTTYKAITEENSGWVYSGSLDQLLGGKVVLEGNMLTVRDEATDDSVATSDTYTIALHMKENADESIMGHKISLNVKLVAYQKASETDDLGNKGYDQLVATERDLREALQNSGQVTLLEDIVLTESVSIPADKTVILDLNGKTISQTKACTESYSMISNDGNLTITGNGKISFTDIGAGDPNVGWASYTVHNSGTLTVENGTIEHLGTQTYNGNNAVFNYSGNTTIQGGTISAPYSRSVRLWNGSVTINGGDFNGQVWVQAMSDCNLTINGGSFKPATNGNDGSSVFVTNDTHNPSVSVTGGNFAAKFGCSDAAKLAGCITGGEFTDTARANTNADLFAN